MKNIKLNTIYQTRYLSKIVIPRKINYEAVQASWPQKGLIYKCEILQKNKAFSVDANCYGDYKSCIKCNTLKYKCYHESFFGQELPKIKYELLK